MRICGSRPCWRLAAAGTLLFLAAVFGNALGAQVIGSQAGNVPFTSVWQVPSGITTELNNYFVAPGYVTLVEMWGIN